MFAWNVSWYPLRQNLLRTKEKGSFECDYPAKTHNPTHKKKTPLADLNSAHLFLLITKLSIKIVNHSFDLFFTICSTNRFDMKRSALSYFTMIISFCKGEENHFSRSCFCVSAVSKTDIVMNNLQSLGIRCSVTYVQLI